MIDTIIIWKKTIIKMKRWTLAANYIHFYKVSFPRWLAKRVSSVINLFHSWLYWLYLHFITYFKNNSSYGTLLVIPVIMALATERTVSLRAPPISFKTSLQFSLRKSFISLPATKHVILNRLWKKYLVDTNLVIRLVTPMSRQ